MRASCCVMPLTGTDSAQFRYRTMLGLGVNFFQVCRHLPAWKSANSPPAIYRRQYGYAPAFFRISLCLTTAAATYFAGPIMITGVGLGLDRGLLALGGAGIAASASVWIGCFLLVEPLGRVRTMMLGSFLCCIGQLLLAAGIANLTPGGPGS